MLKVWNRIPREDLALGLVVVEGIEVGPAPADLARALDAEVARRAAEPLEPGEEGLRQAGRDILRNGTYKPTGRGKPATEYLFRAAKEGGFPRINGPVDANNLVSLEAVVAISVWDLDRAGTRDFEFRLGQPGEQYVFNAAGQALDLQDLVCGCGLRDGASVPMVTPIKDGLATKLAPDTTRIAGAIYYPLAAGSPAHLEQVTTRFLRWLLACGPNPTGAAGVCGPGGAATLS